MFESELIKGLVLSKKLTLEEARDLWQREIVLDAIRASEGHQQKAAKLLRLHRNSILKILKRGRDAQKKFQKATLK